MKKARKEEDDMRPDYSHLDWSKAVRGKYYKRYRASQKVVTLEPDVAAAFPDSASVNKALRGLMKPARPARSSGRR
jgi:hypothetical protein